jgi:dGTPase
VPIIRTREDLERQERGYLAPYAVCSDTVGGADTLVCDSERQTGVSAPPGREHPEPPPATRTHFQRDWHRITHSRAFRKLEYKTQVVVFGEGGELGDVIRNRLTHTLEVSQVATALCRALGLNEDLASAVALAHDLGHTPFGHAGEDALRELVASFNHNDHSLRIVRWLEQRYPGFPGLNLTTHTLAGMEKHDTPYDKTDSNVFQPGRGPSLEAQVASIADEIAYHSHDVEDSLVTGVLTVEDWNASGVRLWDEVWNKPLMNDDLRLTIEDLSTTDGGTANRRQSSIDNRQLRIEVRLAQLTRNLIDRMSSDVLAETARRIEAGGIATLDDVYGAQSVLVGFSAEFLALRDELRAFLYDSYYKSYRVLRGTVKGQMIIRRLFEHFAGTFDEGTYGWMLLPPDVRGDYRTAQSDGADALGRGPQRIIADYIAGMTDREAYSLYVKLFEVGHS